MPASPYDGEDALHLPQLPFALSGKADHHYPMLKNTMVQTTRLTMSLHEFSNKRSMKYLLVHEDSLLFHQQPLASVGIDRGVESQNPCQGML